MHVDDEGTYYLATSGGLFRKARGERLERGEPSGQ